MALYLIHRPAGRTDLKNTAGLHGALVDAADATAAMAAANALAPDLNSPFAGFTAVLVAATAQVHPGLGRGRRGGRGLCKPEAGAVMDAQELLDGYDILFDSNTRLAHEACLLWAQENEPDGWPTPTTVHRFARFYGVSLDTLAGLCGILAVRRGRSHYYCDSRRHPELVNRLNTTRYSRKALAAYGYYVTAAAMIQRDRAAVH